MANALRFKVDENLSPMVAAILRASGINAEHVNEEGLRTASDQTVWAVCQREGRTLITEDIGFYQMVGNTHGHPGLLVITGQLGQRVQAAILSRVIQQLQRDRVVLANQRFVVNVTKQNV